MSALRRDRLRAQGHRADLAREGERAMVLARARPYDAIVLDVMLRDRDGFGVCTV